MEKARRAAVTRVRDGEIADEKGNSELRQYGKVFARYKKRLSRFLKNFNLELNVFKENNRYCITAEVAELFDFILDNYEDSTQALSCIQDGRFHQISIQFYSRIISREQSTGNCLGKRF